MASMTEKTNPAQAECINLGPVNRVIKSLAPQEAPLTLEQCLCVLDTAKALLQYRAEMQPKVPFIESLMALIDQA
jgi:hypothetical protein